MSIQQQYADYDEWLLAKYQELLRGWADAVKLGPAGEATERVYDELLKRVNLELKWVERKGR